MNYVLAELFGEYVKKYLHFTMTVGQAVHAAQMFKPRVLIPYHFSQTPIQQLKDLLDAANSGIDVRIREMQ